ncbi:MAG: peptidoglycan DD-metalloendopeptidase family protein [Clostridiales bacterium]|nr:peptidoglycan DD-metalloendopeptidase family protein [Clostridiales bacterium]
MKKKPFVRRVGDFLLGKGFYMVLLLCVLAIGGSGYYLWWLAGQELETETPSVAANASAEVEVETETKTAEDEQEADEQTADALAEAVEPEAEEESAPETADAATEEAVAQEPVQESQETGVTAEPAAETVQTETEPVAETAAEEAVQTAETEEDGFTAPVSGEAVAAFSDSELTYNAALEDWRTHNGVDLAAQVGEEVYAALDGEVLSVESDPLLGTVITLNHGDGLMTIYGNLSEEVAVRQGDKVSAGQVIGTVGETAAGESNEGGWLHFAVKKDGVLVDPMEYLG